MSAPAAEFKDAIERSQDIPAIQQRLIFKGHILKDVQTVSSYGTVLQFPISLSHLAQVSRPATQSTLFGPHQQSELIRLQLQLLLPRA